MINQNAKITNEESSAFRISNLAVPNEIGEKIVPIVDVNPVRTTLTLTGLDTASGDLTLGATSSTKRTFLVGCSLSFVKDATCNCASAGNFYINVTTNGGNKAILPQALLTTTAQSGSASLSFPPIELDKGSTVLLKCATHTLGNFVKSAGILYYEQDGF